MEMLVVKSVGGLTAENIVNGGDGWISLKIILLDATFDNISEKEVRQTLNELWAKGLIEINDADPNYLRFRKQTKQ